ncbi:MAG: response regulator [Nitrospirae bacterium]|nr:MAG: response regulator [Nitrospirota bacterium]
MSETSKRILVVDDDRDMLNLINTFLKDTDYEVITARRGDDALEIIRENKVDLALIDGLIPQIHGFELCKKIKESDDIPRKPKVIIMSAVYKSLKYKFDTMKAYKADDYLVKPFTKEQLLEILKKHL